MRDEVWLHGLKHGEGGTGCAFSPCALWTVYGRLLRELVQYKSLPKNASFPKDCSTVEATKLQLSKEDSFHG